MPRLTAAQKAARREGIGSSDVAELLGFAPWAGASPVRLFAEKAGLLPDEDDDEDSMEMELGHELEPVLVRFWERRTGMTTLPGGHVVHREHPWAWATLDAKIVGKSAALEIKIVGPGMARDWDLLSDDGVPHHVRTQAAWAMGCADLEEIHVSTLITSTTFRAFVVPRDRELEAMVFAEAAAFWKRVQAMDPPPLDASDGTRAFLEARYPSLPEDVVHETSDPAVCLMGQAYLVSAQSIKATEATKKMAAHDMIDFMGRVGASVLVTPEWRASFRPTRTGSRTFRCTAKGGGAF